MNLKTETINRLNKILNEIETELGNFCKINIVPLNGSAITIGEYATIQVYDAVDHYLDLEGVYDISQYTDKFDIRSISNIIYKKYCDERFSNFERYSTRDGACIAGVCRVCNKCMKPDADTYFNLKNKGINDRSHTICQVCGEDWTKCRYYNTNIDYNKYAIYDNKKNLIAKFRPLRV